ncbi:MAG: hypothetical protein PHG90_04010 [Clostridia bacterium]|jgi:hypothetical protein|nr:hypothetical protein [Clostridia bacterium]
MIINQIAVFLENRSGRICEFARVLKDANINIQTMNIADTSEYGILRAITDNNDKAIKVLKENGFNTASTDLIGFQVADKPGEMHKVLQLLDQERINISYLYSYAQVGSKTAAILLKVDFPDLAIKILNQNGVKSF